MAESDGLRRLKMRQAGHERLRMTLGLADECCLEPPQGGIEMVDCVAHPKVEVGRHLVVPGARGVEPSRGVADQFGQPMFDIHVNVLERAREFERPVLDLLKDAV